MKIGEPDQNIIYFTPHSILAKMIPPIFILTDFGTSDPFVGIMKGVISGISPKSQLIDLTHEILPGDIRAGAIILWQVRPYLPDGSIVLSVVDPGVGTSRRPILLQSKGIHFIGPDNGLFTYIIEKSDPAWLLSNPDLALPHTGGTFHGRDIFAPAAAHLARGVPVQQFGPPITDLVQFSPPRLSWQNRDCLVGEIIHIDRFGNGLTSLGQFAPTGQDHYAFHPWIGDCDPVKIKLRQAKIQLRGRAVLNWAPTFAEIPEDTCGFILGSSGLIEIAANRQSASKLLNLSIQDSVILVI